MLFPSFVLAGVLAWCARGEIVPDWRGQTGSTYQEWQFTTSANPASPEILTNVFGVPSAAISYTPPFAEGWCPGLVPPLVLGTATGFWDIASSNFNGAVTLTIPSAGVVGIGSMTTLLQVVYYRALNDAPSVLFSPGATLLSTVDTLVQSDTIGAWRMQSTYWAMGSSPASQSITLHGYNPGGSVIDRITVDTFVQVPEPSAIGALVFGLLLVVRRRRNKEA